MRRVTDGIHVFEAPQRFYGIEVGARMTVLATDRGWVVHSPIAVRPDEVRALGSVRGALSPNLLHHLYAGAWIEAGVPTWAAPGLVEKRPDLRFEGTIEDGVQPFGPEIELFPLRCFGASLCDLFNPRLRLGDEPARLIQST